MPWRRKMGCGIPRSRFGLVSPFPFEPVVFSEKCLFRTHFLRWSGRFFHGFLLDSGLNCDGSFPRTRARQQPDLENHWVPMRNRDLPSVTAFVA